MEVVDAEQKIVTEKKFVLNEDKMRTEAMDEVISDFNNSYEDKAFSIRPETDAEVDRLLDEATKLSSKKMEKAEEVSLHSNVTEEPAILLAKITSINGDGTANIALLDGDFYGDDINKTVIMINHA